VLKEREDGGIYAVICDLYVFLICYFWGGEFMINRSQIANLFSPSLIATVYTLFAFVFLIRFLDRNLRDLSTNRLR
jgi:hypothetical protein